MAIKVMLVDDSAVIRGLLGRALTQDTDIEIIATAANGVMAVHLAAQHKPDIVILDIEMPEMDGITALPKILEASPKTKVIMASTLTQRNAGISLQALNLGAVDYVAKPTSKVQDDLSIFYRDLHEKVRVLGGLPYVPLGGAAAAAPAHAPAPTPIPTIVAAAPKPAAPVVPISKTIDFPIHAIAIASSTGGPQALGKLFESVKSGLSHVPIFITQHMPPTFTAILAEHLSKISGKSVKEGQEGILAEAGKVYIAPGNYHMVAGKNGANVVLHINQDPQENFCRPAADPMLRSLSKIYGKHLLTIVLTGMGQDGLEGAKVVVQNGGSVIAQDEASSVVYGMPKAVVENNLCKAVLPLAEIAPYLLRQVQ